MTYQHRTRRGAVHWAIAMAIALVGAVTLFAGAALPAGATPTESIASISPNHGPAAGGTVITFTGSGFTTAPTSVSIGANAATALAFVDSTHVQATTPAGVGTNLPITIAFGADTPTVTPTFSYDQPTISNVNPPNGPITGGTSVTISGSNFGASPTVTWAGNPLATNSANNTSISVTTPAHAAGSIQLTVMAGGQTSVAANYQYQNAAAPTITNINPNPAAAGAGVTITGTNFMPPGASNCPVDVQVQWGSTAITAGNCFLINGTTINVGVPAGTGTVNVTVTTVNGTSSPVTFTYGASAPGPSISSLGSSSGVAGNTVNIYGSNFAPIGATCGTGFNGNVLVYYGGVQAACTLSSSTLIYSTVPAGSGIVSVTVVTTNGTSNGVSFTYGTGTGAPNISSITPTSGPVGVTLYINGSNLVPSAVTVGGVNCPLINTSTSTQLACTTAGGVSLFTPVSVVVTTPSNGSATAGQTFYYTGNSAVSVTSVIPNTCPLNGGGVTLYVYGTGFINGSTTVTVNGVIAPNLNVISSTQLSVTCPGQNNYGTYDLNVTSGGNTSANTLNDNVTYQVGGAAPVISNVQPASGPTTGGTAVTITGANFVSPATVTFDGIAATSVVVQSTTTVTAVTPAHTATGLVTVAVSTGNGTDTDVYAFTYTNTAAPTVTAVSPNSGPVGTTVTVTGTNFLGATGVTIGGVAATFNVTSNTTLTATVASGTPLGVVSVLVTTPSGTSADTVNDNFTNTSSKTITTTLTGFFTLIGWVGVDNISVADALGGGPNGPSGGTNNITAQVSVVWGFNSATQTFLAYFPAQANVPGANDLTTLRSGVGYFIGLLNPNSTIQWIYALGA